MSEHMFGCGWGKVAQAKASRVDRIARKVGGPTCGFVACSPTPGRPQYWFFAENRGEPFDSSLAKEVLDAVAAAGIVIH